MIVNVNGGAVSLGHPLAVQEHVLSLLNVLEQNNAKTGAAAICKWWWWCIKELSKEYKEIKKL
jgi:acetyl-CoA acetyltransferase